MAAAEARMQDGAALKTQTIRRGNVVRAEREVLISQVWPAVENADTALLAECIAAGSMRLRSHARAGTRCDGRAVRAQVPH